MPVAPKIPINAAQLKQRLGYNLEEFLPYLGVVTQQQSDELWGNVLRNKTELTPHCLKMVVLDLANPNVELRGFQPEHEPKFFTFLYESADYAPRYVLPFEGQLNSASDYLNNARKLQSLINEHCAEQDQAKAKPVLMIRKHVYDPDYLAQLAAGGFDLIVELHGGSQTLWDLTERAVELGILSSKGKKVANMGGASKYLQLPEQDSPVLTVNDQQIPLKTYVILDKGNVEAKQRMWRTHAREQLSSYKRNPSLPQKLTNEFGLEYHFVKEVPLNNGKKRYELDEEAIYNAACTSSSLVFATTLYNYPVPKLIESSCQPWQMAHKFMDKEDEMAAKAKCHGYYDMPPRTLYNVVHAQTVLSLLEASNCLNPQFMRFFG